MTGVLLRDGHMKIDTQGEGCDNEGRDWSDATASPGGPEITSKPGKMRTKPGRLFLQVSEGAWLADILTVDFWASEL